MLLRQLFLAATAAAFLVVPDASVFSDEDVVNTLPVDVSADAFSLPPSALSQSLELPCRRCKGRNTHIQMDFAVEGSRLTLNGFELYPNADPWHGDLVASVVKGNGKEQKQRLGYSLAVKTEGVDKEQNLEVISVELTVIEVGNRFVEGVPSVNVKLVRAPTNEILIGSLNMNEVAPMRCHSMWCRAKGIFGNAFKGFRGCHKFRHGHGHGAQNQSDAPERPGHRGHHGHRGRPHHEKSSHRQWRLLIKGLASHIFLPVLMGITAGFGVALFAMCLYRLALRFTRFVHGEQQPVFLRCPRRQRVRAAEVARDEEKAALMNEQNLPPYEDADEKN